MRLLHSRTSWHYRQRPDPTVEFCLWVLHVDGLRVPPFDQHPDGYGSLRALGLTEDAWQTWFLRALDPVQSRRDVEHLWQVGLAEYLKISGEPDLEHLKRRYRAEQSTDPPLPAPPEFHHYQASWQGSLAIKSKLIELEPHYRQIADQRERLLAEVEQAMYREERKATLQLYDELKPSHRRLPALNICFVTYASPLDYLIAPATLLMTIQEGQPEFQEFRERVLAAVAELVASPKQRRRLSAYTRREGSTGQIIEYRRHTRKPVPPLLPRAEVPGLDDPLKNRVLDALGSACMLYGIMDLATVQFLREKQRPGWRLYEVAFQEIDGEQHRVISILLPNDDGSWR